MDESMNRSRGSNRVKIFAGLVTLAFAVTLAAVVGNRLSDEALAVLAGAVCGVGAAIPTSLLIVAVSRRRDERQVQAPAPQRSSYPPVVVVAPPGVQQRPGGWNALPPSLNAPMQRHFNVVGDETIDGEMNSYERYS